MPKSPVILIIDDDEAVTLAIATRLESLGYTCIAVTTCAQARHEFRTQPVDLVITDLNMPAGGGIELTQTLRQLRDVPIIFVTGCKAEFEAQWSSLSSVTLLEKPFESDELVDLVKQHLDTPRERRRSRATQPSSR